MRYLITSPWWMRLLFSRGLTWHWPVKDQRLFLTFDDGPDPEITPWVLEQLDRYGFKATFFLIGEMIEQNPQLVELILARGHSIGNHTYDHPNGWETDTGTYLQNFRRSEELQATTLFRPPYGRLTRKQAQSILKSHRIIMWDLISADFDTAIDGERCYQNLRQRLRPGSIVVFHDSQKAFPRLKVALPKTLARMKELGLHSDALPVA